MVYLRPRRGDRAGPHRTLRRDQRPYTKHVERATVELLCHRVVSAARCARRGELKPADGAVNDFARGNALFFQGVSAIAFVGPPPCVGCPASIPLRYYSGMTVQMTIRVDDDLAAFVDQAVNAGEGSRADVINQAIKRELRRRGAERDARIYASNADPDLESDAYTTWAAGNAGRVWSQID